MNDEEINKLARLVLDCAKPGGDSYVAWVRGECVGSPDGPMGSKRFETVVDPVSSVNLAYDDGDGLPEPVAFLDRPRGGHVALWNCEAHEFMLVVKLFKESPCDEASH